MTGGSSPVSSAAASSTSSSNTKQGPAASRATNASPSNSVDHQDTGSGLLPAAGGRHSEDLFALSAPLSFGQPGPSLSDGSAFMSTGGNPFAAAPAAAATVGGGGMAGTGGASGAWGSPVFTGLQVLD